MVKEKQEEIVELTGMRKKLFDAGLKDDFELTPRSDAFCLRENSFTPEDCKNCPRTPEAVDFCNLRDLKMIINRNNKMLEEVLRK